MTQESSRGNTDPKKQMCVFYAGFDEEWTVGEECGRLRSRRKLQ